MNFVKTKIFILSGLIIVGAMTLLFFISPSSATTSFSEDIFPKNLNGIPLVSVVEDEPDEDIAEGLSAAYVSNDETRNILVVFWKMTGEKVAQETKAHVVDELKVEYAGYIYEGLLKKVDWEIPQQVFVKESQAISANYKACGWDDCVEAGVICGTVKDYLILVQITDMKSKPSLSDLKTLLGFFVDKVPGEAPLPNGGEPPSSEPDCGNGNCEHWKGEDCKNCIKDCRLQGYCCFPNYSFVYAHDYHNKKYKVHKAPGGVIPEAAFLVPEDKTTYDLPLKHPSMCHGGGMTTGECIKNYDCLSGVCTTDHWCIKTLAEEEEMWKEIEEEIVAQQIYQEQTNPSHKQEYIEVYRKIEDDIKTTMTISEAKLDVSLEVQGNTAGDIPEVNEGDPVEVRLYIENKSSYNVGVAVAIFYPGVDHGFKIEERKYTISFDWKGGISSLIGSFLTKVSGTMVMPPGSKVYVYSKVVPQQTGYLDAQGIVLFSVSKEYTDVEPGYNEKVLKNYQETEVSESILVIEKPCNWWPICL